MDVRDADLLKEIDPAELGSGSALPAWRRAGPRPSSPATTSPSATSRASSPASAGPTAQSLDDLATRLGVPTEHLLRGVTAREYDEIKLTLDFAELSLETGQHLEAESQAREARGPRRRRLAGRARLPWRATSSPARSRARATSTTPSSSSSPWSTRARAACSGSSARSRCAAATASPVTSARPSRSASGCSAQLAGSPLDSYRRGRADGGHPGGAPTSCAATRPGRAHLPQGDHQGRDPRLRRRARFGVLERQHLRGASAAPSATPSPWPSGRWP